VITSVNPVVDNQPLAARTIPGTTTNVQDFQAQHPDSVAFAQAHQSLLLTLNEPKNKPAVAALAQSVSPANIARATAVLGPTTFAQLVKYQSQLTKLVVPYQAELNYLSANQADLTKLQNGVARSPQQWKDWFWVCVGGMVLFIPTIWLNRGRWSPTKARKDEDEHKQDVERQLSDLAGAST
jgi:hypothetical protein